MPRRRSAATDGGGRRLQLWTERHAVVVAAPKAKAPASLPPPPPPPPPPPVRPPSRLPLKHACAHTRPQRHSSHCPAQHSSTVGFAAAMARLVATVRCGTAHGAEDWVPSTHGAAPHATGLASARTSRRCCARPSLSLPNRNGTMSRQPTPPHTHAHAHAPSVGALPHAAAGAGARACGSAAGTVRKQQAAPSPATKCSAVHSALRCAISLNQGRAAG
jgi:hypothetical protein